MGLIKRCNQAMAHNFGLQKMVIETDAPAEIGSVGREPNGGLAEGSAGVGENLEKNPERGTSVQHSWTRFIANPEDAVGHIAFALFIKELLGRRDLDLSSNLENALRDLSDDSIATIYTAAAKRIRDEHFIKRDKQNKMADLNQDVLFLRMHGLFTDKYEFLNEKIDQYMAESNIRSNDIKSRLKLSHQIMVAAIAGIMIGVFVYLSSSLPSAFSPLNNSAQSSLSDT